MFLIQLIRGEIMCNDFPFLSPYWRHLLKSKMISFREDLADITRRSIRVARSFLNEKPVNCFAVTENDDVCWPKFQGEDGTVLPGPFTKSADTWIRLLLGVLRADVETLIFFSWNRDYTCCPKRPVDGIWWAFPRMGIVGGPGGIRLSLFPRLSK